MIDTTQCNIRIVSAHSVGNKFEEQGIKASDKEINIDSPELRELLLAFFIKNFSTPELFEFTFSNENLELNPVFQLVRRAFQNPNDFHQVSVDAVSQLYDCSMHPNIKSGDFYMTYFSNIVFEDQLLDAIGLFKIESQVKYLKLDSRENQFQLDFDLGVDHRKLDKGCLIFNTDDQTGYKMCVVDNTNRAAEARYWKDMFLNIRPTSNSFHLTSEYLSLTREFIKNQMPKEASLESTQQAELLNKSIDFFKEAEVLDKSEFKNRVLKEPDLIESFRKFEEEFEAKKSVEFPEEFEISSQAVKKKIRSFKSVLKLDKNFHVYIHGDRSLIEKGFDQSTGKSFYKIYFDEEK